MIYGFAQHSGGQVRIDSEVGVGTTVSMYLPRHMGPIVDNHNAGAATLPVLQQSRQVATVLVVDDAPAVRMLISDILQELGLAWIEAADSTTGLKILQSEASVDLLISDVCLPGDMNGRQMDDAARLVRPSLPVLFITDYVENAAVEKGFSHREWGC